MSDATHDAEHMVMIATATAELEQLQRQVEVVLQRARPALAAFSRIATDLDNDGDEWNLNRATPFYNASGLTAFGDQIIAFGDSLQRSESLSWLFDGDA